MLFRSVKKMRLDTSGNLLVGKTSSNIGTAGSEVTSTYISGTRADNSPLFLNRTSSDGSIITFRKDNSAVGNINTGSNLLAIESTGNSTGLLFGTDNIFPRRNLALSGGTNSLGSASYKFKDGFFSNIVYSTYHFGSVDTDSGMSIDGTNVVRFVTGNSEKARVDSSATPKFFVGCTANPSATVAGSMVSTPDAGSFTSFTSTTNASTHAVFGNPNGVQGHIQTNANSTSYFTTSDRRLKSNIQDAASASNKIDAIQVRQFDWNADDAHQDYGLIAQELKAVEPLAVSGNEDSDAMMSVDYSKLVPILLKEIQELRSRVAALEE